MIAKTNTGGSFKGLLSYLSDPKKMEWMETRNTYSDEPMKVAAQMEITAEQSRATKPVYHLSLSWSEFDAPTKNQMLEVADDFLKHMGLEDHQVAIIAHSDRAHPHVHLAVNRVHPETEKAWELWKWKGEGRDRTLIQNHHGRVEEFLRHTERQYGWQITQGKHAGQEKEFDGRAPELWEIKQDEKIKQLAQAVGIQAGDGRSVKERADELKDQLYQAKSFAELDKILAQNGLWIKAEGQGAVFTDGSHQIKSSSVSRGLSGPQLEKRFGENLKDYVKDRDQLVQAASGEQIIGDWASLQARVELEGVEHLTQSEFSKISGQLKRLESYDQGLKAARKEIREGFTAAFEDGKQAYREFGKYVQANGYDQAQAELAANPHRFGKVADIGAVVQAGDAIRNLDKLQGRYSTQITNMAKDERAQKIQALKEKAASLGQRSQPGPGTSRALKGNLYKYFREGLQETEAGRSVDSSVIHTISMSKALNKAMQNPQASPLVFLKEAGKQSGKNMTSEAGEATSQITSEGIKYLKNAGEILANPGAGSAKLVKNIIQSSVRQISKAGRGKGLSR